MTDIQQVPANSGNYTPGRTAKIDHIVIHIAEGSYAGTLAWFQNPKAQVSAHYTVGAASEVGQSVSEQATAWHSGLWAMNARSIGIEHEGKQNAANPWQPTPAQLEATAQLVADLCRRWDIPVDRDHIIGHNEVQPGRAARANCPGKGWPWPAFLARVSELLRPPAAHQPSRTDERPVRLFSATTNKQIGTGTLISGTDKIYLPPDVEAALRTIPPK